MNVKHLVPLVAAVVLSAPVTARAGEGSAAAVSVNATNRFTITGMHCDGCANGLTSELKRTPGVAVASVTFSNQLAVVAYDTNRVTTAKLLKVIEEAGFKGRPSAP